jgi:Methane oxygenase PmoA
MTNGRTGSRIISHWVLVIGICLSPLVARADVTAERRDRGVVVKIDGKLFTEYLTKAGHAPAMWPVIGPTGKPVTRSYPFTAPDKEGTRDHPHHQSFWFAHDKVNGLNFWGANANDDKGADGPHIDQREFVAVEGLGSTARIVSCNDWIGAGARICEDQRTIVFGTGPSQSRWIDFTIVIKADNGDVTFGDTKEGTFALRVADTMRVDAKKGGQIVNSEGQKNEAAWGMPARWVDYTGPVEGETVGIAMMSHPTSFRPMPRWHVRTYGLFAANPFGEKDFPAAEIGGRSVKQGAFTIKNGDSLTLRYRVLLHRGTTNAKDIERAFREFAAE